MSAAAIVFKVALIVVLGALLGVATWAAFFRGTTTTTTTTATTRPADTNAPKQPQPVPQPTPKKTQMPTPSPAAAPTAAPAAVPAGNWTCAVMPQSWSDESLFARLDANGNLEVEANAPNTGANFREKGVCQKMLADGFKPANAWKVTPDALLGNDWAQLAYIAAKGDCGPYCGKIPSKEDLLKH